MSQHERTWGDDVSLPRVEQDKRRTEVNGILTKLRRVSRGNEGKKYYPIRFFRDGIDAYLECFDNAAIYYTSLAVELALIVRLGEKGVLHQCRSRKKEEEIIQGNTKQKRYCPTFSALITQGAKAGLLDSWAKRLAHNLRKARNSYMHYYNIMWCQIDIDSQTRQNIVKMLPKVKRWIQQSVQPEQQDEILRMVNDITVSVLEDKTLNERGIPIQNILPNREAKNFIEERRRSFAKQLVDMQEKEDWEFVRYYLNGVEWKDALDCLQWSVDILTQLQFLPQDDDFERLL